MNHILKKDYTLEKDYRIISQQFGKIIPFGRRSSSAERKSIRILKNSIHRKTCSNSKKIIFPKNIRFLENNNPLILTKNMSSNAINIHRGEKLNDIKIIKENNITDINIIFKNKEKARTFNRQSNTNINTNSGLSNISKIKSNHITYNNIMRIKNDKHKNNREIYKKKLVIENPALSINDLNNKTTSIKNKILIRNNSGFNMEINNIYNSGLKRNTDISQGKFQKSEIILNPNKEIKNARKIKFKNKVKNQNKEQIININHDFNYTMNAKIKKFNEINNIQDLKQKIIISNSFKKFQTNENKNTNLNILFKKRKNIDINTEFQMDPIIHKYSMDYHKMTGDNFVNNVIYFNNTTTSKVKLKMFEINKEKENTRLTENNIIFKNKAKTKVKSQDIIKKDTLEKDKNNLTKVKKPKNNQKNVKNDINRNNTYNNDSSFFTINNNGSNMDENNNNEAKHNIVNYYFVSSAHDKDKMNNLNINSQNNNTINNKNAKKINQFNVFKTNSNTNTNKNKILQNSVFDYIIDSHNFTTENFSNIKHNENNKSNNKIIINQKIDNNSKMVNEIKSINVKKSMNNKDNNDNKDNKDKSMEKTNKEINIIIPNNIEEIKEKDTFLDKSTSRVIQMHQEDFIEKDDEVLKLLNPEPQKENNNNNNNNNNINQNEEESEVIIQNSELSIINNNYILNNQNIYQNININIFQNNPNNNNNNKNADTNPIKNNNNQNPNINIDNTNIKDISISSNCGIRASKSLTQAGKERTGHRKKNQDNYIIEKNINNIFEFNIFAVLDGHGDNGHIVSQLASKYLIKKFTNLTKDFNDVEAIYNFLKKSDYQKIINIFLETDTEIITKTKFDVSLSGSTCVFVIQLGEHIICANIGDSRAILIYEENGQNKIFELSRDSKPDVPEEKKRIEILGGIVDQIKDENGERTGPFRVYMKNTEQPGLAMSRSFGDKKAKYCGVIPIPDIIEYNLKWNYKYMVICSDGVWEFMSNEEVMEIGDKYFYQNDINEFCNQLLKRSTEIWEKEENYMDDITIVVVFF